MCETRIINALQLVNAKRLSELSGVGLRTIFRIRDGRSGIAYYEASLDGEWVLMTYDFKFGTLQSDKLDPKKPFKGDFELKVVDRAGNERIFKQKIL